jgi:predicted RNA binding protein YcfA (HicA-like mRNA interferase family)
MSKFEKLIERILNGRSVSYSEAENLLKKLGFKMDSRGSHHVFRKPGYPRNVTLKQRSELLSYQTMLLIEVLKDHGY